MGGVAAAGLLTHYFFLFVWAAMLAWLLLRPGRSRSWGDRCPWPAWSDSSFSPGTCKFPASLGRWRRDGRLARPPFAVAGRRHPTVRARLESARRRKFLGRFVADRCRSGRRVPPSRPLDHPTGFPAVFAGHRLLLWLWVAAPIIGLLAFDVARHTSASYVPRYVLGGLPAAMLLAALAIEQVRGPAHSLVVMFVIAAWTRRALADRVPPRPARRGLSGTRRRVRSAGRVPPTWCSCIPSLRDCRPLPIPAASDPGGVMDRAARACDNRLRFLHSWRAAAASPSAGPQRRQRFSSRDVAAVPWRSIAEEIYEVRSRHTHRRHRSTSPRAAGRDA